MERRETLLDIVDRRRANTGGDQSQRRTVSFTAIPKRHRLLARNLADEPDSVAVYYYRSQHYDLGDAKCWVDDNEKGGVTLAGYWAKQYNVAMYAFIFPSYLLDVMLTRSTVWRISTKKSLQAIISESSGREM